PPPGTAISYYLKSAPGGDVKITISDVTGKVVRNLTATKQVGLNRVMWNLRGDPLRTGGRFGPPGANLEIPPQSGQTGQPQAGQGQAGEQGQPGQPQEGGGGGGGGGRGGGRFGAQIGPALDPGIYLVKLSVDGKEMTTKVVIEADSMDR